MQAVCDADLHTLPALDTSSQKLLFLDGARRSNELGTSRVAYRIETDEGEASYSHCSSLENVSSFEIRSSRCRRGFSKCERYGLLRTDAVTVHTKDALGAPPVIIRIRASTTATSGKAHFAFIAGFVLQPVVEKRKPGNQSE